MSEIQIGLKFFEYKDSQWIENEIVDETSRSWVDLKGKKIPKRKDFITQHRKLKHVDIHNDAEYLRKATLAIHDFMLYGGRNKINIEQAKEIINILNIELK